MVMKCFFIALLIGAAAAKSQCNMGATSKYPPPSGMDLPWYDIDLDKDPKDRWTEVVVPLKAEIESMIYQVIDLLPQKLRNEVTQLLDQGADRVLDAWPAPFGDEIRGIADATGIDISAIILFNIGYELEGGCTSMVAKDENGLVYHARNLDFGLFLGWDQQNRTWELAEKLRPLLFNARIMKGGKVFYNATYYAGFVGLLSGMKTGGFSITVDTRFDNSYWRGLIDFFKGTDTTGHFVAFTTRQVMETAANYSEALQMLQGYKMVGPSYMILGGVEPNEGAIITRSTNESLHLWTLENDAHKTGFYVIETNYDNWVDPPFFDDRRSPAEECLQQLGPAKVNFESLFNVLSAEPNLNLLTTYTTLMNVKEGKFER